MPLYGLSRYANQPPQSSGGSGFFGVNLPNLGLSDLVHQLGGAATGLFRLGYDPVNTLGNVLVHGPGSDEAHEAAGQMRKDYVGATAGIEASLPGTAADIADIGTLGQAHGITDRLRKAGGWIANQDYKLAGVPQDQRPDFTPQGLSTQIRQHGILPTVLNDLGNSALVSDAAGGLLKLGELGKVGEAARTAEAAGESGATAGDLRSAMRAAAKADGIDATKFTPEQVAARSRTLDVLHTAGHPYSALFRGAVRPLTMAANESALGRAAEAGAAQPAVNAADVAREHLAYSDRAAATLGAEDRAAAVAPALHPDLVAAMHEAAARAPAEAGATLPPEPAPGTTRLYRGEQIGNQGGTQFADTLEGAQGHAGPNGRVLAVDVPNEVLPEAAAAAKAGGNVGFELPEAVAKQAVELGPGALRPATEIPAQAAQSAAEAAQGAGAATGAQTAAEGATGAQGATGTPPRRGPVEMAARLQAGAAPPDWARTVIQHLPQAAVDALQKLELHLQARRTRAVQIELTRFAESERRKLLDNPALKPALALRDSLVGHVLEDGSKITPEMADKMIGGAVTKLLDGTSLIEKLGVPEDVVNAIVGVELGIPEELRTPELMDAIGHAAEAAKAIEDQRLAVYAGSRLGTRGFEDIGSDTPALTKSEQALWKSILAEVEQMRKMDEGAIPRERARFENAIAVGETKAGRIGTEVERLRARQATLRERLQGIVRPEGNPVSYQFGVNGIERIEHPSPLADLSERQMGQRLAVEAGETPAAAQRRGYQAGRIVEEHNAIERQIVERTRRQAAVQAAADDLRKQMLEHTTPSEMLRSKLEGHVQRGIDRLSERMDNPSVSRAPGQWKPLWGAVKQIETMAKDNPELAEMFAGVPTGWREFMRVAAEHGIDPTFVSSLSENQVRKLVFEQERLGQAGREAVQIEGGARKVRVGAFARERTLSALAASLQAAHHEAYSNAVVDFIEHTWAKPIENGVIAKNYVPWDGVRTFIRTGEKIDEGQRTAAIGLEPTMQIPKQVRSVVEDLSRDHSHATWRGLQKINKPWQALMLGFNPAFQVHHLVVKVGLAVAAGARFEDFAAAWHDFRSGEGKFREAMPSVNYYGETEPALGYNPSLKDRFTGAVGDGNTKVAYETAMRSLSKPLDVIDRLTRAAVYSSELRKGVTSEAALGRIAQALGDYSELSSFEQQVVRSVMPFYAFQKTIIKVMLRWPMENPKVVAIAASLARMNTQAASDAAGMPKGQQVPQGYEDLFKSPLGVLNLHSLDPFAKVEQIVTPQGIASSLNPFLSIAVKNAYGVGNSDHLKRVDAYGHLVDDTSPASDITKLFAGAPQAKLVEGVLGLQAPGQNPSASQNGPAVAASQFTGVPVMTPTTLQAIIDRTQKSQQGAAQSKSAKGAKTSLGKATGGHSHAAHRASVHRSRTRAGFGTGGKRGRRVNVKHVLGAGQRGSTKINFGKAAASVQRNAAKGKVHSGSVVSSFGSGHGYSTSSVGDRFKTATGGRSYRTNTAGVKFNSARRSR